MPLVHAKIAKGTANYCSAAAMSAEQFEEALAAGAALVEQKFQAGCNCIGLGEMGIGNTASASLIAHQLTGLPLTELVGRGTGLDDAGLAHKTATLQRALDFHALAAPDPAAVLRTFGGFEIVMLVGALLRAAERQMLILVDGFIATAAALAAVKMHSNALAYCVFCHASFELGHKTLLRHLGAEPLLQLDMRLGEGSGAALAYPLVAAAVTFLNSMASFDNAGVSRAI